MPDHFFESFPKAAEFPAWLHQIGQQLRNCLKTVGWLFPPSLALKLGWLNCCLFLVFKEKKSPLSWGSSVFSGCAVVCYLWSPCPIRDSFKSVLKERVYSFLMIWEQEANNSEAKLGIHLKWSPHDSQLESVLWGFIFPMREKGKSVHTLKI